MLISFVPWLVILVSKHEKEKQRGKNRCRWWDGERPGLVLKTLLPWAVSAGFFLGLPRAWISKLHEASSSHFSNEETKAQRRDYGSKEKRGPRVGMDGMPAQLHLTTTPILTAVPAQFILKDWKAGDVKPSCSRLCAGVCKVPAWVVGHQR